MARNWRWRNVPLPELHISALVAAECAHWLSPWRLHKGSRAAISLGWFLLVVGVGSCIWAVQTAGNARIDRSDTLLTHGPYTYTRNPMYVGWMLILVGISLIQNTAWLFLTLPLVGIGTDRSIRREEDALVERFGDTYREYLGTVPRYL